MTRLTQSRSDCLKAGEFTHEWFKCACCPPNIMRFIASLGHYLATASAGTLYLHQFTGSRLSLLPVGQPRWRRDAGVDARYL